MKAISGCLALVLVMALGAAGAWGQQADIPRLPPNEPPPPPIAPRAPSGTASQTTVSDVLAAAAVIVFGVAICWALAMIAFTSMIRSRQDPAAAYWQSVGGLLFGAWLAVFLGASGLLWDGIWDLNWWIWGFYLAVGVIVAIFVARLGRQARTAAG